MISWESIDRAEENVVGALRREGGELSFPEVASTTKLPFEIIIKVLDNLMTKGIVEIKTQGTEESSIRLARLVPRSLGARFSSFFAVD